MPGILGGKVRDESPIIAVQSHESSDISSVLGGGPLLNCLSLGGICVYSGLADHMPQVVDLLYKQVTLGGFQVQSRRSSADEVVDQAPEVISKGDDDDHVVQKYEAHIPLESCQNLLHQALEAGVGVG